MSDNGESGDGMRIKPSIFNNVAICKTKIEKGGPFNEPLFRLDFETEVNGANIVVGERVWVRLFNVSSDNFVRGDDTARFNTVPRQLEGEDDPIVQIPADVLSEIGAEVGDTIAYAAIADDKIPGIKTGPFRDKVAQATNSDGGPVREQIAEGQTSDIKDRGRQQETYVFEGKMFVTGQVTIPKKARNALNIYEGDTIPVIVEDQEMYFKEIGNGNRITINKDNREELGLPAERSELEDLGADGRPNVKIKIDLSDL